MQIAKVILEGAPAKLYDYYSDLDMEVGDYVVVPTGDHFGVGKVERVGKSSSRATKWVVQKVDLETYKFRMSLLEG